MQIHIGLSCSGAREVDGNPESTYFCKILSTNPSYPFHLFTQETGVKRLLSRQGEYQVEQKAWELREQTVGIGAGTNRQMSLSV